MGCFVNPDGGAFQVALNSEIYVDKTGLLSYTNKVMDTKNAWICNSRPRRFGKSITADMLTAYYSKGCESAPAVFAAKHRQPVLRHVRYYLVAERDRAQRRRVHAR